MNYPPTAEQKSAVQLKKDSRSVRRILLMGVLLMGCSDGGDEDYGKGDLGNSPGTVGAELSSYCVARFTEDTEVFDTFSDLIFTAEADEEYLMASYGSNEATLLYLTSAGPVEFDIEAEGDLFPFESTCTPGDTLDYIAALTTVAVYDSEDLDSLLCTLEESTVLPYDSSAFSGYSALDFSLNGPAIYEVYLNAFSALCADTEVGYIRVPEVEAFGTTTWLVPIMGIIGPN